MFHGSICERGPRTAFRNGKLGKEIGWTFFASWRSQFVASYWIEGQHEMCAAVSWRVSVDLSVSLNSCQSQSEVKQKHLSHQKSFLRLKLQPSLLKLWLMQHPRWSLQQQLGLQLLLLRLWCVIISCFLEGQPAVCFHYNSPKADCLYNDWKIGSAFNWSFGTMSVSSCNAGVGLSRWM